MNPFEDEPDETQDSADPTSDQADPTQEQPLPTSDPAAQPTTPTTGGNEDEFSVGNLVQGGGGATFASGPSEEERKAAAEEEIKQQLAAGKSPEQIEAENQKAKDQIMEQAQQNPAFKDDPKLQEAIADYLKRK